MASKVGTRAASGDGRVQRGARNNEAIVQAIYELIRERHLPPTVDDVAERARVGRRTVFRQFEDMDALYRAMGERVMREVMSLVGPMGPSGDLEVDLVTLVQRRARVFEHITPFRRVARFVRHESALLQEQDRMTTMAFRGALLAVVEPHLPDDSGDTLEALDLLLSFEAWERLRHQQDVSVKRAQQILTASALALLEAASEAARARSGGATRRERRR